MGELEECGWKKAEEKKEAEVGTYTIMSIVFMMTMGMVVMRVVSEGNNKNNDN